MSEEETNSLALVAERVTHEGALRKQAIKNMQMAVKLQAIEYERRLGELNHAHARAEEARSHTVSRELFETWSRDLERRVSANERAIGESAARDSGEGSVTNWLLPSLPAVVCGILALLTLVVVLGQGL